MGIGAASGGFEDGADIGIEFCAPFGAKTVSDFPEHRTGPQRPLRAIVGRRNVAIGDEDEQMPSDLLDDALELDAGRMRRRASHESVEASLKTCGINLQGGVGETFSPSSDATGAAEQVTQFGREDAVARIDGILHITNEMGEADLILLFRPTQLAAVAVGDPEIRAEIAEEGRNTAFAARGIGDEDGAVVVMKHP